MFNTDTFIGIFPFFKQTGVKLRMLSPVTAPVTRCHEVMTEECWPRLFSWQCPVCPVPGSGHEVSVCNFSRHPMSCSGLQSPRWSLTTVSANQRPVSAVLTNERPRLAVDLTWHLAHFCANYRPLPGWCLGTLDWPSWPRVQGVKKLVILKEVVCDGSKMKLNDMVSEIGQSSLFSSPVRVSTSHLTHYLTTLVTRSHWLGLLTLLTRSRNFDKENVHCLPRSLSHDNDDDSSNLEYVKYFMLNVYRENCISWHVT